MLTATPTATATRLDTGVGSLNATSSMDAAQDRFLKLLVAQLNNQDPMNPLDNAQLTSQMAQINTVTGIQQVNDTLKGLADQFATLQVLQGANLVGHDVLVQGDQLYIRDGSAGGAVTLSARAESVKIDILSPAGQVLDRLDLGPLDAGQHAFSWDASSYKIAGNPHFQVSATLGGKTIDSTALTRATVQAVGSSKGAMTLQLQDGSTVTYKAIEAVL